jgi:hypothetical protein
MVFYGGLPSIVGVVGVSVVSKYSLDGDETGEIRLRIELDDDLVRDIYGLGAGLGVVSGVKEVAMEEIGDRSPVMGTSPKDCITSIPNSSVRGRGGGRSTIASRSFDEQSVRSEFLISSFQNTHFFPQLLSGIFTFHFCRTQ